MTPLIQALLRHYTNLSLTAKAVKDNVPNTLGYGAFQWMKKGMGLLLVAHIVRGLVLWRASLTKIDKVPKNLCNGDNQWEKKPDKHGWYRPCKEYLGVLIKEIITVGLPCIVMVVHDKKKDLIKIEFTPLPGWIHLCNNPEIAPWQYHISCGKGRTMDYLDWKVFNAAYKEWNGKSHVVMIESINQKSYVMTVSTDDKLSKCLMIQRLRSADLLHRGVGLTISA